MKRSVIFALLLTPGMQALAQDGGPQLNYGIGARAQYESNVTLASQDEISDNLVSPFLDFDLNRLGSRVDATLNGFLEYTSYLDDSFESEFRGTMAADVRWKWADDRFNWVLQNDLTRSSINVLAPNTPDNVQQTNALSTGPDLVFRLGAADRLRVGARYNDFYAEEDDDASYDGFGGEITWLRRLSENRSYELTLEGDQVDFDESLLGSSDYDRQQILVAYNHAGSLTGGRDNVRIEVGYSELEFDDGTDDTFDGPIMRLTWDRVASDGATLSLSLIKEIGDIFRDTNAVLTAFPVNDTQDTAVTGAPFEREEFQIGWTKPISQRTTLNLQAGLDRQDYSQIDLDQEVLSAEISFGVQLRPLVQLNAGARWTEQEFNDIGQEDEDTEFVLGLSYQRTRNLFFEVAASYQDQDSTNPLFRYDNSTFYFQVVYRR
ncbi:MAG: outer membrane beta-barrel protein [Xanthomonadales bacterium]|nr:outer membrane beta-barrel protein [Xanthomonadales bacterium]